VVVNAVSILIASFDSKLGLAGKYGSAFGMNASDYTETEFMDAISDLFSK